MLSTRGAVFLLSLFLFLASIACGDQPDSGASGQQQDSAETAGYQPGTWLEDDFEAALTIAQALGRPVVMDLHADWCGPCHTLADHYFSSSSMQPILEKAVLLRMDVDTPEGGPVAQRFGVNAIPAVMVLLPDGREVDRIIGVSGSVSSYGEALDGLIERAISDI